MKSFSMVALIFLSFLLLRLTLILTYPPFVDEVDYILWGQNMVSSPDLLFSSTESWRKQPLSFWLFGLSSFLSRDPVVGPRLLALIISSIAFFMLYDLVKNLAGVKVALFAIAIYTFTPVFVFFQGINVMVDPFLFTINTAIIWLIFKIKKNFRLSYLTLIGLWLKNIAIFMALITVITVAKYFKITHAIYLGILAFLLILPLILRGDYSIFLRHNFDYTLSFSEFITFPFNIWVKNLIFFLWSAIIYFTPIPLLFLCFLRLNKEWVRFCIIWFFISTSFVLLTSKTNQMRWYLFAFAPLIPLMALGLSNIIKKFKLGTVVIFTIFAWLTSASLYLVFYPQYFFSLFPKNSIVALERNYATYWPSAYNIHDAIDFFEKEKPKNKKVVLGLVNNGSSAVSSYLSAYYRSDPLVDVLYFDMSGEGIKNLQELSKKYTVFIIINNYFIKLKFSQFFTTLKAFETPGVEYQLLVASIK